MRDITVWIHDGSLYLTPRYILENRIEDVIKEWKKPLLEEACKANAEHFIFCTKIYDMDDNLIEINLYQVPLSEKEFNERIALSNQIEAEQEHSIWYGVWHKGTNY